MEINVGNKVKIGEQWFQVERVEDTFVVINTGKFLTPIDKKYISECKK
jgi:hypothetical protein